MKKERGVVRKRVQVAEDIINVLRPLWTRGAVFTTNDLRQKFGKYDISVEVVYLHDLAKANLLNEELVNVAPKPGGTKRGSTRLLKFTVTSDNPHEMSNRLYLNAAKTRGYKRKKERLQLRRDSKENEIMLNTLRKEKDSLEFDLKEMKEAYEELEEKLENAIASNKRIELNGIGFCPKCHLNIKKYSQRLQDLIKECEV